MFPFGACFDQEIRAFRRPDLGLPEGDVAPFEVEAGHTRMAIGGLCDCGHYTRADMAVFLERLAREAKMEPAEFVERFSGAVNGYSNGS